MAGAFFLCVCRHNLTNSEIPGVVDFCRLSRDLFLDDLFRGIHQFKLTEFRHIPAAIELDNLFGDLDAFGIVFRFCKFGYACDQGLLGLFRLHWLSLSINQVTRGGGSYNWAKTISGSKTSAIASFANSRR